MAGIDEKFKQALAVVMDWEGGYSNHLADKGGKTKYGITERVARQFHPDVPVRELTREQATGIYFHQYWEKLSCDKMEPGVALLVFDCAVNQGPSFAAKTLQKVVRAKVDGIIGPKTLFLVNRRGPSLLLEYAALRGMRYASIPSFGVFGKGWLRRLLDVYEKSKKIPL